jgi:hypothetical protein
VSGYAGDASDESGGVGACGAISDYWAAYFAGIIRDKSVGGDAGKTAAVR